MGNTNVKGNETKSKLSFKSKLAYGLADIYGGGAFLIISTFFIPFMTYAIGMEPFLAGTIPLIGKIWDAITDPLMGNIVERTKSKYGAKRFYMLIGSIISAITFLLLWIPLEGAPVAATYAFYVAMYILFSTGFTIVMVPYNGLLPDMVEDYTARAKFSSIRTACSAFGAIIAGLIPSIIINDQTVGSKYLITGVIFSVIFLVTILLSVFGTWEKKREPVKLSVGESFKQSFTVYRSHSFKIFILIFLCGQGAADFLTSLAVYYVGDVLNAYGGGRFTMLMGVVLLSQFVGTIVFSFVMPKTSKKFPILIGFPIRIVASIILYFISIDGAAQVKLFGGITMFHVILFITFIIGMGMAASSTTIYALLTDMADVDELITSVNRPGIVSGMATFVRKIATGLSSTIIGGMLAWVGFNSKMAKAGIRQTAATCEGIKAIYIFAPIVLMVLTIIFTVMFPLQKKEFEVIKKEIARRKGEDNSAITEEEVKICEKITGFKYENLWKKENISSFKNK